MDNNKKYWFFGSKLNTVLLVILIILMVVALRFMYQNKGTYLPEVQNAPKGYTQTKSNPNSPDYMPHSTKTSSTTLPKYMTKSAIGAGWPPVISTSTIGYSCIPSNSTEAGTRVEKIINGTRYCVYSLIDAGAGNRDGQYTYAKASGSGTKVASFSLHWVSCAGYGGPGDAQFDECDSTQTNFFNNLDALIDGLMS